MVSDLSGHLVTAGPARTATKRSAPTEHEVSQIIKRTIKTLGFTADQLEPPNWRSYSGHHSVASNICGVHITPEAGEGRNIQGSILDQVRDIDQESAFGRGCEFKVTNVQGVSRKLGERIRPRSLAGKTVADVERGAEREGSDQGDHFHVTGEMTAMQYQFLDRGS